MIQIKARISCPHCDISQYESMQIVIINLRLTSDTPVIEAVCYRKSVILYAAHCSNVIWLGHCYKWENNSFLTRTHKHFYDFK